MEDLVQSRYGRAASFQLQDAEIVSILLERYAQNKELQMDYQDRFDGPRSWIFQGNPKREGNEDLIEVVRNKTIKAWSVFQHRKLISSGDIIYIWFSGIDNKGIYAVGKVTGPVTYTSEHATFSPWWVNIEIDRWLGDDYIPRDLFISNNVLGKSTHANNKGNGTNFRLTDEEASEIARLVRSKE